MIFIFFFHFIDFTRTTPKRVHFALDETIHNSSPKPINHIHKPELNYWPLSWIFLRFDCNVTTQKSPSLPKLKLRIWTSEREQQKHNANEITAESEQHRLSIHMELKHQQIFDFELSGIQKQRDRKNKIIHTHTYKHISVNREREREWARGQNNT